MNAVVAVSGGVDSVVLLDMLARRRDQINLIVAHFDHGIRPDSAADARFVEALARRYQLPCRIQREELGSRSSEARARRRRYTFLKALATEHRAKIITAHHQDDVIETIAINLVRGTGWRGLAVMGDEQIVRPLLHKPKAQLTEYALQRGLEWVEDETNQTDTYLRNRLRRRTALLPASARQQLTDYTAAQRVLRREIEGELDKYAACTSRYIVTMMPRSVALEVLRHQTAGTLIRPQLERLLLAVKTARAGSRITAGAGVVATFTANEFIVTDPHTLV